MKDELIKDNESPTPNGEVNYEENDNWQFEAEAPTLNDTLLDNGEIEISIPAAKPTLEMPKENKVTASPDAPVKSTKLSANGKLFAIIGAVLAVLLVALTVLGIFYYDVPNSNEKMNPGNVAMTVDKTDVSIGMYNYYYTCITQNYISYAGYGYYDIDTSKPYDEQTTTDDDGNEITWAEKFEQDTIDQIRYITSYYSAAKKNGVKLTDAQLETIDSQLDSIKTTASESNLSVNEYIKQTYGDYCGYATLKKMLEQCYIAENYYKQNIVNIKATKEETDAYFAEHGEEYMTVPFAYLQIMYDGEKVTKADAEAIAKEYSVKIKNVDDLKKALPVACKDSLQQYVEYGYFEDVDAAAETLAQNVETTITRNDESFTEEGLSWLFSDDTNVGDCSYFAMDENNVIFIVLKTGEASVNEDEVYSVRHILVTPKSETETDETTAEDASAKKTYTDAEWKAAYESATKILDEYKAGEQTELAFALLAEQYSDDVESTSNGSSGLYGGLYAGTTLGMMVPSFEEWSTDDSRQYGDVDIVKSDYGYHIMYFVEDTQKYIYDCEQAVVREKENQFLDAVRVRKHKRIMKKAKVVKPAEATPESQTEAQAQTIPDSQE